MSPAAHPAARRLIAALAMAALAAPALADAAKAPVNADSRVDAVTVYPDRAVVTRAAKVELPAGESEIVFKNLPQGFLEDSLQVGGEGVKATILDVTARAFDEKPEAPGDRLRELETKAKAKEEEIKALEKQLRAHQRAVRAREEAKQVIQKQQALVDRIEQECLESKPPAVPQVKEGVATVTFAKPKVEDFKELLAFSGAKAEELKTKLREHDEAIEDLREQAQETTRQLGESRMALGAIRAEGVPQKRVVRGVVVRVDAAKAGDLVLKVSYAVGGASWSPSYDVRLKDRDAAVTYFGNVWQRTGEDWNDAKLTLSTAKPDLGGREPGLTPWALDVRQVAPAREAGFAPAAGGSFNEAAKLDFLRSRDNRQAVAQAAAGNKFAEALADKDAADNPVAGASASFAAAQVAAEGTHASFQIAHRTSIPSRPQSFRVSIAEVPLAGKLQYQATPALNENAYLTGYFKLAGDHPFLAGPTRVFLGDTFVGADQIPTTMPGGVLRTSFGADDGIVVKRKLVDRKTETTGFTNSGKRTTYTYEFTLENRKKTAERVVFRDHLPVSKNEKIEVEMQKPAKGDCGRKPASAAEALALKKEVTLEDDGELCWRIDLAPGEKRVIPFAFAVEHPAGMAVDGL